MTEAAPLMAVKSHKKLGWVAGLLMGFIVVGCTSAPPKCGDKQTVDLLYQIVTQDILPAEYKTLPPDLFASKVSLKFPAPTKYEKEIQKYTCEAKFVVDASKGADKSGLKILDSPEKYTGAGWSGIELDAIEKNEMHEGVFAFNVRYTSQSVEGKHLVGVTGIDRLHAFLMGTFVAAHFLPIKQEAQPSITYQRTNEYPEVSQYEKDRMAREAGTDAKRAEDPKTMSVSLPEQKEMECPSKPGEMEQTFDCQDIRLETADADLNAVYKITMSRLSQSGRNELRTSQQKWIKDKENCSTPVGDGANSMLTEIMAMECKTTKTIERTKFLHTYKPS